MPAILQNIVVCPHCGEPFEHNKINGVALVQLASDIEARKRVCLKLMLDSIERSTKEPTVIRKIILDHTNDLVRDIHTLIGFGIDTE